MTSSELPGCYTEDMISIQECISTTEWDEYVVESGGHPFQLSGWGTLKSLHGWKVDRLFVIDDEKRIGCAQILTKTLPFPFRAFSYIPRGQVFHVKQEEALDTLAHYVKQKYRAVTLSIEPDTQEFDAPAGWTRATNKILPAETILLDITRDTDTLLADMAKKTRQYIRKSEKDVTISQVKTPEQLAVCLELYEETARRAGFALHDEKYYIDVRENLGEHSPIFIASVDGAPVAFLWLAISGDTAYELYGGVNEIGQQLRANYALKWHAIQKAKQWGLTQYDFGGVISGGVATFKQGWSDGFAHFAGTYDRPLSPFYVLWSHALPFAKKSVQRMRALARR